MRLIKWLLRPTRLVGLAILLVTAGLALGVRARWNAGPGADVARGRETLEQAGQLIEGESPKK